MCPGPPVYEIPEVLISVSGESSVALDNVNDPLVE